MSDQPRKKFIAAMREFFGFRPGTGLAEFSAEIKALSADDKLYFANSLRAVGIDCEDPISAQ